MSEKLIADTTVKTAQAAEKGAESLMKKAWTVMDAASEKQAPSQFLGDHAVRSIQGRE